MADQPLPEGERLLDSDLTVGLQRERVPVTSWVDAYYWRCEECGWLGTGLYNIDSAQREAGDHYRAEHQKREVHIVRKDVRP